MRLGRLLILPLMIGSLAACQSNSVTGSSRVTSQTLGAGLGAIAGGLAGSQIGSGTGQIAATAGGVLLGGLLGGELGRRVDDNDRRDIQRAQNQALYDNQQISWNNPDGNYGTVTPTRTYNYNGQTCRDFVHSVYIDGRPQDAHGTACLQPDGSWQIIS